MDAHVSSHMQICHMGHINTRGGAKTYAPEPICFGKHFAVPALLVIKWHCKSYAHVGAHAFFRTPDPRLGCCGLSQKYNSMCMCMAAKMDP